MLIGKRISDRYKILEYIGGGGMANVYLARDVILERDVAVKILRLDFANDEDFIRRFHREALSATSLVHPNIVNIYDVGEEDNIYYIVMEYVEGETLKQYIQKNAPLPVEKVIDIMLQITSAINHAHQNNIIHRDIKPENILVNNKGTVKITDFGIAMALTSTTITHTNSVLGSVHYLSPEQARGAIATKKSDIYSLGIVMFELLTGRLPFSGESAVSIALKHLQEETPSPKLWNPLIPQSVENIILKSTAKDPHYRYDNIEELEKDLATALNPDRLNEPPFRIPVDEEATKAIPVIKDERTYEAMQETIVPQVEEESIPKKVKKSGQKTKGNKKTKANKKRKWPLILTLISLFIIVFGILFITVFPSIFGKAEVKIPDVINMELEEAISELEDKGLVIGKTTEIPDDEIEENHVVSIDPKVGKVVKEGTEVHLFVSTGKEKLSLQDYRGQNYEDVLEDLQAQTRKFKKITKNEVFDKSDPGTIIDQNPAPDEEIIPEETELIFTVSKGEETFSLADLTEYSTNALNNYAKTHGISIKVSGEEYNDKIPKGSVIRQDINPNTKVKKGDTVYVVISKGEEPLPPKTVTIDVLIPYSGGEEGESENVQIFVEDMNHQITVPFDSFDITQDTRKRFDLVIAPNTKGRYKVVIDGDVVHDEEIPYNQ